MSNSWGLCIQFLGVKGSKCWLLTLLIIVEVEKSVSDVVGQQL